MTDLEYYDLCTKAMGQGEPARVFGRDTQVWSAMAVRAAILRALEKKDAEIKRLKAKNARLCRLAEIDPERPEPAP
jgi:hypothetical protein